METIKERIDKFFENIEEKTKEEVKKIKKLAMSNNIRLTEKRKKFCKHCYSPKLKVKKIEGLRKTIECRECGKISRWRIKKD